MIGIKFAIILVIMITAISCSSKKEQSYYPADFKFVLKSTSFKYDSQTRRYNHYDRSVIVALTDKELQEIYQSAVDINFLELPNEFECDETDGGVIPCFKDQLLIRYNDQERQSENDDCCSKTEKDLSARFDRLVIKITDILNSKEAVKNLPKYNILNL